MDGGIWIDAGSDVRIKFLQFLIEKGNIRLL